MYQHLEDDTDGDVAASVFGEERSKSSIKAVIHRSDYMDLKPRRANPEVLKADFFKSLVKSSDGRYFFSGILNGWPGYSLLELSRLERLDKALIWKTESVDFNQQKQKTESLEPWCPEDAESIIAILHKPKWTDIGFLKGVPGHVWYYSGAEKSFEDRKVAVGTQIMKAASELDQRIRGKQSRAVKAYLFCYRLARSRETFFQRQLRYHRAVFLEWDHGEFGTIVEFGKRNEVSGCKGKSDWVEDKYADPCPELDSKIPADLKVPQETEQGECRIFDISYRNVEGFKEHLARESRFVDPTSILCEKVTLKKNTKAEIFEAILNRVIHSKSYSWPSALQLDVGKSCLTFGHAFFAYLTNVRSRKIRLFQVSYRIDWFGISYKDRQFYPPEYNSVGCRE